MGEKERKIAIPITDGEKERDGAWERVDNESEKNAKMHAAARWRAGGGFDEDRASRERVVIPRRRKERPRKRNSDARGAEDVPIRTEMETRGGTSARGDRESAAHRANVGERARGKMGGEKERR